MGYYYNHNFTSPEGIYAIIREELKSYMDTGVIDDLMFPTYTDKCLRKLGRTSYVIREGVYHVSDYMFRLPDNFHAVREAWLCTELDSSSYQLPSSFYSQSLSSTTIQISPMLVNDMNCVPPYPCADGCDPCMPNIVQAVYKTNETIHMRNFMRKFMLRPGNISTTEKCEVGYMQNWANYSQPPALVSSPHSFTMDSFDIRGNKFLTTFREGIVDLVFYASDYDVEGNQLVPDNFYVMDYIEKFIKFKMYENLLNLITDETFNQIQTKLAYYKQQADEAYVLAFTEVRRDTAWDKVRKIKRTLNRFKRYELPGSSSRSIWKRS